MTNLLILNDNGAGFYSITGYHTIDEINRFGLMCATSKPDGVTARFPTSVLITSLISLFPGLNFVYDYRVDELNKKALGGRVYDEHDYAFIYYEIDEGKIIDQGVMG